MTHIWDEDVLLPKSTDTSPACSLLTGCWNGTEDEALSKQRISARASQVITPKPELSTEKTWPRETCDALLKDILCLIEHSRTQTEQEMCRCEAELYQPQKHTGENLSRRDTWRLSFLKNHRVHMAQKTFTQGEMERIAGYFGPSPTPSPSLWVEAR